MEQYLCLQKLFILFNQIELDSTASVKLSDKYGGNV